MAVGLEDFTLRMMKQSDTFPPVSVFGQVTGRGQLVDLLHQLGDGI